MAGRCLKVAVLGFLCAAGGCEERASVETELYVAELEQQIVELQAQLTTAWQDVAAISGSLSSQVAALELSVEELNLRVMDLRTGDPQFAIREVEAAVVVVQQRLEEVKATSAELARYVE